MGVVTLLSKAVIIIASITFGVAFLVYLSLRVRARNQLNSNEVDTAEQEVDKENLLYLRQSYYEPSELEPAVPVAPESKPNQVTNEQGPGWETKIHPTISKHVSLNGTTEEPVILDESFRNEPQQQPLPNIGKTTVNPKQQDWNDFIEPGKKPTEETGAVKTSPEQGFLDVTDEAGNSGSDISQQTPLSHAQSVFMKTFGTYATEEPTDAAPQLSEEPYSSLKPRLFQLKKPKGSDEGKNERLDDNGTPEWK